MPLIPILESKSQNGIQIFKSLKLIPFLLKRLKFAFSVKSSLMPLEGVPRVSSSIFFNFLIFFIFEFFLFFYFFFKIKKFVTCQAVIVPHGSDRVMWQ